ncbi:hypothetical protein DM860_000045 [Cuscuta australis]|uniref:Uncharacterized protein n=1 Tax=Cuscuta australis TaxID=267555 RepID=A0A328CYF8_9ASTE|nr:hypothetical protein DM860_000045 [Cuscuta australis]
MQVDNKEELTEAIKRATEECQELLEGGSRVEIQSKQEQDKIKKRIERQKLQVQSMTENCNPENSTKEIQLKRSESKFKTAREKLNRAYDGDDINRDSTWIAASSFGASS